MALLPDAAAITVSREQTAQQPLIEASSTGQRFFAEVVGFLPL